MHILQPKHTKLKKEETKLLLKKLNITPLQLPKIKKQDPALPPGIDVGDIVKIERKFDQGEGNINKIVYYRVVVH